MSDRHRDEIVRLVTASAPQEAHLLRQALEGQGIPCRVVGEYLGGFGIVYPGHPGPELWARRQDRETLGAVIEEELKAQGNAAQPG
jgi:hypothetical protein